MTHPLLAGAPGDKHLLLGNEAIVRGALEAGVDVVTCYPGTPSSEVPDTFYRLSPDGDFRFEYSVNEKVALEVAGGATLAGALTLCTMKHVGVNVAADPLMTLAYIGTPGGLLLLSADDPGCHSSQNEQDNRYYARLAGMPCFEPCTAQEATDMAREALTLSRQWEQPVMLRTTTRLNHLRGVVEFGPRADKTPPKGFIRNPRRFVPVPAVARVRHGELLKHLTSIAEQAEASPWVTRSGNGKVGVVASGMSRAYLADAMIELGLGENDVTVLELGMSWPLPEKTLIDLLNDCPTVLVLEEGEPLLENDLRALAQRAGIEVDFKGKGFAGLTRLGEYDSGLVSEALRKALGRDDATPPTCAPPEGLPMRPPNLCPGCPHRSAYLAVRRVFGDDAVYSSDIGCYTLGLLPPLSAADYLLCMGSSVSAGCGTAMVEQDIGGKPVVAFIGDSTFFHSGVTGLINAVFNNHDVLVVVLDNRTTAMTGHQPHPGVEATIHGACEPKVDIEAIVRGCGVCQVATVNPLNVKKTTALLEEFKAASGVRVLIASEPCPLHARRMKTKSYPKMAYVAEQGDDVTACLDELACPAFRREGEGGGDVVVAESMCSGCMVCLQLSTNIKSKSRAGGK